MDRSTVERILGALGFRTNTADRYDHAVRDFQWGWNLGHPLLVDGVVGPLTSAALEESATRHAAGHPDASDHFSFREFICHCGGEFADCRRIHVARQLLSSLELWRAQVWSTGLPIVSGYRCPNWNAHVGGAVGSRHVLGLAADVPAKESATELAHRHLFAGIGYQGGGLVVHVDRRDLQPDATADLEHPDVFRDPAV